MYVWILIVHSLWRWVVLAAGFAAVGNAALGLTRTGDSGMGVTRLGRFFGVAVDIQVLMGAALFLVVSPLTTVAVSTTPVPFVRGSDPWFFAVLHPLVMASAFILVHIAAVLIRRGRTARARQRRCLVMYGITLLMLLCGMPWWRPWWRL